MHILSQQFILFLSKEIIVSTKDVCEYTIEDSLHKGKIY